MELMDSSSTIGKYWIPKLIETPEHFIMNSQIYDKQSLKPVPMEFEVDIATQSNEPYISLKHYLDCMRYYHGARCFYYNQDNLEKNKDCLIQDKQDSNVFYLLRQMNSHDSDVLFRIERANKKYYITHKWSNYGHPNGVSNYNHKGDINIIYETDDFFVVIVRTQHYAHNGYESNYSNVYKLRKKDFALTGYGVGTQLWPNAYLLHAYDNIVYIVSTATNVNNVCITKVNLSSDVLEEIIVYNNPNSFSVDCNFIELNGYYYAMGTFYNTDTDKNKREYKLIKLSLNTSDDTTSYELLDIPHDVRLENAITNEAVLQYTLRKIDVNGQIYLSCLISQTGNGETTSYNRAYQCKLITFLFNETSLSVVDVIPLTDGCRGSLIYNDSEHLILYMSNGVLFYVFDRTKKKFVKTFDKPGLFKVIGLDSLNRFITQNTDDVIEMLTELNACTLYADFAEELYDKSQSSEVDTTVSFYAKNFLDEYLETNVKLTLIGPVVFKENNQKTLVIQTLKTGLRTVPVTITGNGAIEVIITQNT